MTYDILDKLFTATECPFCHETFALYTCCYDSNRGYYRFYHNDDYVRMLVGQYLVLHYRKNNRPSGKTKIAVIMSDTEEINSVFNYDIEIDYSDLQLAQKKIEMILAFR